MLNDYVVNNGVIQMSVPDGTDHMLPYHKITEGNYGFLQINPVK